MEASSSPDISASAGSPASSAATLGSAVSRTAVSVLLGRPETARITTAQQAARGSSVFCHRGRRRFRGAASARMAAMTPSAKPSGTSVSSASGKASRMVRAAWT